VVFLAGNSQLRKLVEGFGEDIVQTLEAFNVSNLLGDIKHQYVDLWRIFFPEPSFIVVDAQLRLWLGAYKRSQSVAAAKRLHQLFVVALELQIPRRTPRVRPECPAFQEVSPHS